LNKWIKTWHVAWLTWVSLMSKLHKSLCSLYILIMLLRPYKLLSFLLLFIQVVSMMLTGKLFPLVLLERLFWNLLLGCLPVVWRPTIISHPFLNASNYRQRLLHLVWFRFIAFLSISYFWDNKHLHRFSKIVFMHDRLFHLDCPH
jgi:hypothetical protein